MSSTKDTFNNALSYIRENWNELSLIFIILVGMIGLVDGPSAARFAIIVIGLAWLMNYRPLP